MTLRPLAAALITAGMFLAAAAQARPQTTPMPTEAMTSYPALSSMRLSPDGKHLAAIVSEGENRVISVWRTEALNETPRRIALGGAALRKNVRFVQVDWIARDRLFIVADQPFTFSSGPEGKGYTALAFVSNIDGSGWAEPLAGPRARSDLERFADKFFDIRIIDDLPNDPDHVLIEQSSLDASIIYRVNAYTGRTERVLQVADDESVLPIVDNEGDPRVKRFARFEDGDWEIGYRILNEANGQWEEHPALMARAGNRTLMDALAFDPENNDILIVRSNKDGNFAAIYGYSVSRKAFVETMFAHPNFDATGVVMARDANLAPTHIAGFNYWGPVENTVWVDPEYEALYKGVQARLPGQNLGISAERPGGVRLVSASSSRHPPNWWLLRNGTLTPIGTAVPSVNPNTLADTQFITYRARDGMEIPGFLTLPKGWTRADGPLPTIIQPHGGPWSRNDADWRGNDVGVAQYFASRGFAVLEPQYRGSEGFGDKLWKAGDGQWGMAMQDDKDDGLKHLVDQGIADPAKAIIYGFSYGGFAAIAATVRPNSPYRCAISGAGVSSLERIRGEWGETRLQRRFQGRTVNGMDPLQNADKANIPILMYHGDRDETAATMWHSQQFAAALAARGKPHELHIIKDFPHGGGTPSMLRQELSLVENFVRNTCGITY
jgi:dipeptidyl aminopeptidase/acylaminoacyl peptidase